MIQLSFFGSPEVNFKMVHCETFATTPVQMSLLHTTVFEAAFRDHGKTCAVALLSTFCRSFAKLATTCSTSI